MSFDTRTGQVTMDRAAAIHDARRMLNPSFFDYEVPNIKDHPDEFYLELVTVDDPLGPSGAKSCPESASNGTAPAIAVAIHDATGVWMRRWPFTSEAVLAKLRKSQEQRPKRARSVGLDGHVPLAGAAVPLDPNDGRRALRLLPACPATEPSRRPGKSPLRWPPPSQRGGPSRGCQACRGSRFNATACPTAPTS